MEAKVILIVGQRGSGKTTDTKNLIKNIHPDALLLHDASAQYTDIYKKPILPFDEFTELCTNVSNAFIVFEEATIFINHSRNKNIVDFLVTSRHKKNSIVFVFHSFRSIPRFIYDLSNVIICHKTKDPESLIFERFEDEDLLSVWKAVKANTNPYYSKTYFI